MQGILHNCLRIMSIVSRALLVLTLAAIAPSLALANEKDQVPFRPLGATVSITADGTALVRGATVTSVSDDSFVAETTWGDIDLSWTVETDSDTEYVGTRGEAEASVDIETGDSVSFSGKLRGALSVAAEVVKSWSMPSEVRAAFQGTVKSVDIDSFVLADTRVGDVTIEVTSETSFSSDAELSDIEVGDRVAASGSYDTDAKTLTALKVVLNPEKPDREHPGKGWGPRIKAWFDSTFHVWKK